MAIGRYSPPGLAADLATSPQVPDLTGGDFLVLGAGDNFETRTAYDSYHDEYVQKYVTPTDQYGIPYPIAPTVALPVAGPEVTDNGLPTDDLNHQFEKAAVAKSGIEVLQGAGGAALIGSRVQRADYGQHHDKWHPQFTSCHLPTTKTDLITRLLLTSAGWVPEHAVDLSGDEPEIVRLNKKTRRWLWTSEQIRVLNDGNVSNYLKDYVLDIEVDHLVRKDVEDFLYTFNHKKRIELGFKIARELVERAVEPLEPDYQEVRKADVLTFARVGAAKRSPPERAADLTLVKLMHGSRAGFMMNALQERLSSGERRPFMVWFEERMAARAIQATP